jgi:hypothetical protein
MRVLHARRRTRVRATCHRSVQLLHGAGPQTWHVAAIIARSRRSSPQKMGLSRSRSQHGSGVVVGAEVVGATVGAAVVGAVVVGATVGAEVVGAAVVTVGAEVVGVAVGLAVRHSLPRLVPATPIPYGYPGRIFGKGPHSPLYSTILHRRTQQQSVWSESIPSQRPGWAAGKRSLHSASEHTACTSSAVRPYEPSALSQRPSTRLSSPNAVCSGEGRWVRAVHAQIGQRVHGAQLCGQRPRETGTNINTTGSMTVVV